MKNKTILVVLLSIATLALAIIAVVTALRLQQIGPEPVAPTAPEPAPAVEPVCTLVFTVEASPSPSPSPSTSPSPSPSVSPSPSPSPSPSVSPSPTPTPSPSPPTGCYNDCVVDADCSGSLICSSGGCVNANCPSEQDCTCNVGGPQPSPETVETVELPEAGISLPTLGLLSAGLTTVLLGVLVLLL